MAGATEVQYLVLPDSTRPYLLARVRWPDVAQAISAACPEWQEDPGLFDLPYDPAGVKVTPYQAAAIAASWGARLPSGATVEKLGPTLVRRMPANWSELSPAEKRAWSLELVTRSRRASARQDGARLRGAHSGRRRHRSLLWPSGTRSGGPSSRRRPGPQSLPERLSTRSPGRRTAPR